MVRQEGGRWDVGTQNNAVYLERISENDKRLFDDLLAPEEARELAELLTKYAAKLEKADSTKTDDSGKSDKSDDGDSEDSDNDEDSDKSDKSDDKDSEESDDGDSEDSDDGSDDDNKDSDKSSN